MTLTTTVRSKSPGGTPLYKPDRYVPPQRVGFGGLFGLKTGIHFAHFGLESGMVYERTTGAYLSFDFEVNKKEIEICEFEMDLKKCFVCALI